MSLLLQPITKTFQQFFDSEKSSGILLIICTIFSLVITNSALGSQYLNFWQINMGGLSLAHWINDALMAVFFLLIGLELERELYSGELSNFKNALLPIFAAFGGLITPALIHFSLNAGTTSQAGMGIPMATDIAFALGVLAILGSRIPPSLKMFIVAFAVIDDLSAIIIIAIFYTAQVSIWYLAGALSIFFLLIILNRFFRIFALTPYLLGGAVMWILTLKSGVHATVAGVMLAFAIPYSAKDNDLESPSHRLEHILHKPVAFVILPIFALANTSVVISADWMQNLISTNSIGVMAGLLVGKPLGVTLLCFIAVTSGLCRLPPDLNWRHIFGAGILGGIGFTMSIFITNLAFSENIEIINASKTAILLASLCAGAIGFVWLNYFTKSSSASQ